MKRWLYRLTLDNWDELHFGIIGRYISVKWGSGSSFITTHEHAKDGDECDISPTGSCYTYWYARHNIEDHMVTLCQNAFENGKWTDIWCALRYLTALYDFDITQRGEG